jgi:hypothetical protein
MNLLSLFIPVILGLLAGYLVNYVSDVLPFTRRFSQPSLPKLLNPFFLERLPALTSLPLVRT